MWWSEQQPQNVQLISHKYFEYLCDIAIQIQKLTFSQLEVEKYPTFKDKQNAPLEQLISTLLNILMSTQPFPFILYHICGFFYMYGAVLVESSGGGGMKESFLK